MSYHDMKKKLYWNFHGQKLKFIFHRIVSKNMKYALELREKLYYNTYLIQVETSVN